MEPTYLTVSVKTYSRLKEIMSKILYQFIKNHYVIGKSFITHLLHLQKETLLFMIRDFHSFDLIMNSRSVCSFISYAGMIYLTEITCFFLTTYNIYRIAIREVRRTNVGIRTNSHRRYTNQQTSHFVFFPFRNLRCTSSLHFVSLLRCLRSIEQLP